jgi:hypothetical protein
MSALPGKSGNRSVTTACPFCADFVAKVVGDPAEQ